MSRLLRLPRLPLTLKVPLLVAALVIVVAVIISQVVLSRLIKDQEANLALLANAYLDGLSAAVLPAVIRGDVWETFDALDRARGQYTGLEARYAIAELPNGSVLAASDPIAFPIHSAVPGDLRGKFSKDDGLVISNEAGRAWLARGLRAEGFSVGRILAEIDIAGLLHVRSQVVLTLILVNGGLAIAFSAIGYFAVKHMLQPLGVLSRYVEQAREGRVEPIPSDIAGGLQANSESYSTASTRWRGPSMTVRRSPRTSPNKTNTPCLGASHRVWRTRSTIPLAG